MSRTLRKFKDRQYPDKDGRNRKPARCCLNHGGCEWCTNNRLYNDRKRRFVVDNELKEYIGE